MAVSLLTSGNSGVVTGNGSVNVSVTTGAGNRKLLVGIAIESSANADVASLTFNGQELVALGLEVPGTPTNPNSFARTVFYEQFEGGMPADGTSALAYTWSSATGDKAVFYWLVDGANQGALATGAEASVLQGGASGSTLSDTIAADDAGAFLASVAYRNNTTGTLQLTAPASSTMVADLSAAGSGARLSGGHRAGLTVGSNTVTWTFSTTTDRRCLSAVVVNSAPDSREVSGGFTLGAVTTAGLVSHERELGGGFVTPAVELSAAGDTLIAISGGFSIGAVQLAGGVVHANVPGSVLLSDRAYGSVNISDGRSGSVLITDRARDA